MGLRNVAFFIVLGLVGNSDFASAVERKIIPMNTKWVSVFGDPNGAEQPDFDDSSWKQIAVPHNWEDYQGYRKLSHGNLHGTAWYRKRFTPNPQDRGKQILVMFEGVGSYAEVWLNGVALGKHAGGRTCFWFDVTEHLDFGKENLLAVRADHPEKIQDLPYVCGGCWGSPNTEGSQPLGIFRPVNLIISSPVCVEPYGVHVWTPQISEKSATVQVNTEVRNNYQSSKRIVLVSDIINDAGEVLASMESTAEVAAGEVKRIQQNSQEILNPHLWSCDDPYLHQVRTKVLMDDEIVDSTSTRFGMRWIEWPVGSIGDGESEEIEIDATKLAEKPSLKNHYFSEKIGGNVADSPVKIQGAVQVFLPDCNQQSATVRVKTTVRNRSDQPQQVLLTSFIRNYKGTKFVFSMDEEREFAPGETYEFDQTSPAINFPELWSEENPYLHVMETTLQHPKGASTKRAIVYDKAETPFGIRAISGLANKGNAFVEAVKKDTDLSKSAAPFLLNGKPLFLNGTCEYEHLLGNDHAFTEEQIRARMMQIKAAGFNAFRDAHHPHNLLYLQLCDELGILCWTQIGAHIYFDNEQFRDNYRQAVREWVRERRNSPSVMLWGLQNESTLPEVFARELTQIVRDLDPTTSSQRKTATCNGGKGSDWDVPQNWLGTYRGNVNDYGEEIVEQKLIGEYGQWRTMGLHQEGDWEENWAENQMLGRVIPEELFTYCLQKRVFLAEQKRQQTCGHFQWIFTTHANPGRDPSNCRDGMGLNDVGVVNYKGLITSWGEPIDAYYMFRANYAPKETEPMVYIHSHSWPDRFDGPGEKSNLVVQSNCDTVEFFNDYQSASLGVREKGSKGTHFEWDNVPIKYNVLYAEGKVDGKIVASDMVLLNNLPPAPRWQEISEADNDNTNPMDSAEYVFRINCGGEEYSDVHGNIWQSDSHWRSWAQEYEYLDPRYASVGRVYDPIAGTRDDSLHQTYRYGREKLKYKFDLPNGKYVVELYFSEPWYGTGGGMNCQGWRIFDIAINGQVVLDDFDIWQEVGHDTALKKTFPIEVSNGNIEITFPEVKSYQSVISAIAIRKN